MIYLRVNCFPLLKRSPNKTEASPKTIPLKFIIMKRFLIIIFWFIIHTRLFLSLSWVLLMTLNLSFSSTSPAFSIFLFLILNLALYDSSWLMMLSPLFFICRCGCNRVPGFCLWSWCIQYDGEVLAKGDAVCDVWVKGHRANETLAINGWNYENKPLNLLYQFE